MTATHPGGPESFAEREDGSPERAQQPNGPTPEYIESQRQAALSCLVMAERALRSGMIGTVKTQLMLIEVHLRAMEPGNTAEADHG